MWYCIPLAESEIEACHRLPSKRGPKPVILRFANRKRRDEIFALNPSINEYDHSRFGIVKNVQKLYINDSLSPKMRALHYYGRRLRRENYVVKTVSDRGLLKIKVTERGPWKKIRHELDITELFPDFDLDE